MSHPSETDRKSRREFLVRSISGACFACSTPLIATILTGCGGDDAPSEPAGNTQIQVDTTLPAFQTLAQPGGRLALNSSAIPGLPRNGVFILRTSDTEAVVLDRTCTHQQCQVGSFAGNGIATCPCHGSQYNTEGNVVRGPAPRALRRYQATITDGVIEFTV
jgi:cytochrome b6-f complex iron-sulfur subunit